jgi:predicted AlkP superfamily phosphohydrolase/phosphomutase
MFCSIQRAKASLYLMKSRNSDFFMTVFTEPDRLQHSLWDLIVQELTDAPPRSSNEREIRALIVEYYQMIDTFVGKFAEIAGEDTNLIMISDHGFGQVKKQFGANNWLEDLGLLHFDHKKMRMLHLKRRAIFAMRTIDVLKLRRKLFGRLRKRAARIRAYDFLENIRWDETKAYTVSNTEQGIYLNVYGREPRGIVKSGREFEETRDLIMDRLKELRDPQTNERLVTWMMKGEDLYTGAYAKDAPDIIFVLKDGEYVATGNPMSRVFEEVDWKTGSGGHRMEGVFLACGKGIRSGMEAKGCSIIDIAPTILNMMGVPIPGDMDGKVLHEIFTEGFQKANPPLYTEPPEDAAADSAEHQVYSEEEAAEIEEKLRGLGYM